MTNDPRTAEHAVRLLTNGQHGAHPDLASVISPRWRQMKRLLRMAITSQ
jgi:hypothetical protein